MNPYTTTSRARIQPRDLANATRSDPFTAAASLTVLERMRACEAEAELAWLLKTNGVTPNTVVSLVTTVQQAIGVSLVRLGARLAPSSASGASPATAPVSSTLASAD